MSEDDRKVKQVKGYCLFSVDADASEFSTNLPRRSLLNLANIDITSAELLQRIMILIFDKALSEPEFGKMYAELCELLAKSTPDFEPGEDGKPLVSNFNFGT